MLALLPTPAEVGPTYEVTSDDGLPGGGNDDDGESPANEQCPAMAALKDLEPYAYDGRVAAHSYGPDGESTIGVELADGIPPGREAVFEGVVADLAECATVTLEEEGYENAVMSIDLTSSEEYGDFGVASRMTLHYELYGQPFDFESLTRIFVVGAVQVTIVGRTSPNDDGSVDPVDIDAVNRMATLMEQRAKEL